MLRFVATPHDLNVFCALCNTTVEELSENTGIPEEELYRFAKGEHPLLARDRFAIMFFLQEREAHRASNAKYGVEYLISLCEKKQDDEHRQTSSSGG